MLGRGFQRATRELQSHRRWLHAFQTSSRSICSAFPLVYNHTRPTVCAQRALLPNRIHGASYAKKNARSRQKTAAHLSAHEEERQLDAHMKSIQTRNDLRQALAELRISDAIRFYDALHDKSVFNKHDFRVICQTLHHCLRSEQRSTHARQRRERKEELAAFAETLVKDLKMGVVLPNSVASIHLLGFFKEAGITDAGLEFWKWLEGQDDFDVSIDVYGAAIELSTVAGASLDGMEDLYRRALVRFPANFASYHLSPNAIVPDRDRAVRLPGIPMSLLQGIMTARLLHGDTKNAYLALDTALRLYPDQTPARFFSVFLDERPLPEVYTVFALACRAGIVLPANRFKMLQTALRLDSDLSSAARHAITVRGQISALYMYLGAGGQIAQNTVNELIVTITQFLRLDGVISLDVKHKQQLAETLVDVVRTVFTILARFNATPGIAAFNSIITNLGGFGHTKQIVAITLADAKALGLEPSEVTRRSVVTAASMVGDKALLSRSWKDLVAAKATQDQSPDMSDWHTLVKACHLTENIEFARQEFKAYRDTLTGDQRSDLLAVLEDGSSYNIATVDGSGLDLDALSVELVKIQADLQIFEEVTRNRPTVQDFGKQPLPMTLLPVQDSDVAETEMRNLYDEMTTETSSQGGEQNASAGSSTADAPTQTTTSIPFGELRYMNWKSVNWLLEQADASDRAYIKRVDEAIAIGAVPPRRTTSPELGGSESYGLSDVARTRAEQRTRDESEAEAWRQRILALRGRRA